MSYQSTILADSPLHYYRGSSTDRGSLAANATANGTVVSGANPLLYGDAQTSLNFGGAGTYSIPTAGLPVGANAFSAECWINMPSLTGINFDTIFDLGTNAANEEVAVYIDTTTTFYISLGIRGGTTIFGPQLFANITYYICVSYDGTTLYLDVFGNGTHNQYQTNVTLNITYGSFVWAGGLGGSSFQLHGLAQELAIYNSLLNNTQIAAHHAAGQPSLFTWQGNHKAFARQFT